MKLKTSFFNATILKKDILRFAPIWALYTVILMTIVFTTYTSASNASNMAHSLSTIMPFPVIYAFICATFLFGDLFKTRMCNALHAMPLRRETFFFTHFASGMLYALIPNLLCSICMSFMMKDYAALPWLWLAANIGKFFFYFSLAAFCVMCAGNRLGHIAAYLFILFLFPLIGAIYTTIYQPILYGVRLDASMLSLFSPVIYFEWEDYFSWNYSRPNYYYGGLIAEGWIYLGVCVLIGVAFLFGALYLYRRRNLENAGNFITSKVLAYALLLLGSILFGILIPVVGFIIAFIGICMLMERSLKVFHKKNIIIFAAFAGTVLLTLGLTALDPLGVEDYIPKNENIQSVSITGNRIGTVTFEDSERIQVVQDVHAYALDNREFEEIYDNELTIAYTLNSGVTVRRIYYLDAGSFEMDALRISLSSMEVIFGTDDLAALKKDMRFITGYDSEYDGLSDFQIYDFEGLLNALALDAKEGHLAQDVRFHTTNDIEHHLSIEFFDMGSLSYRTVTVYIYKDCTHTLAFLEDYT